MEIAARDLVRKMAAGGAVAGGAFDHLSAGRLDLSKVRKIATNRIAKALSGLEGKKVRALPWCAVTEGKRWFVLRRIRTTAHCDP